MSSEEFEEWEVFDTAPEALNAFYEEVFDFADIILNLTLYEEKQNPDRYASGDVKRPSTRITLVKGLLEIMPPETLCRHYVNYVLTWKSYIDDRNDRFFLENDHIYPGAPPDFVEFFRGLWRADSIFHLTSEEKETVYEHFDAMLHYCEAWKQLAGYTARWELVRLIEQKGEDAAFKYIMSTYNVKDFEDFGFEPWDEFVARNI